MKRMGDLGLVVMAVVCAVFCGCASGGGGGRDTAAEGSRFELRKVVEGAAEGSAVVPWAKAPADGQPEVRVARESSLDARHVKRAEVEVDPISNRDQVKVTLTREGAEKFGAVTRENIGKRLAVLVDGKVMLAPVIREPISGGVLVISGNFSGEKARAIAGVIGGRK